MAEQQMVVFGLGKEEYGVEITQVQEIVRLQEITNIPNTPDFVEGVVNLRGKVIPLIDLKKRFALEQTQRNGDNRIIVISVNDSIIGVIVDYVSEVLRIPDDRIEPPPAVVKGIGKEYLKGIGKISDRLLILLDLDKILSSTEQEMLKEI